MAPDIEMVFQAKGQTVTVTKLTGEEIKTQSAYNANDSHFTFRPKDNIDLGDIITDSIGSKYIVLSVEPKIYNSKMYAKYANVTTERAYNEQNSSRSDTYNIGTAVGSVIGSQTNATITNYNTIEDLRRLVTSDPRAQDDKGELQELISAVNALIENNIPAQKNTLSRFAELLQKNAWIATPIATTLLRYFTGI